jgi:LPXTG-site transpeptidase (sortase) family protein
MNPATLNTTFNPATSRNDSADKPRRVYLDTYAKRRSSESVKVAAEHPDRKAVATASIPMQHNIAYTQTQIAPVKAPSPKVLRALSRRAITLSRARNVMAQPVVAQQQPIQQAQHVPDHAKIEANLGALYSPSLTEQLSRADTKSASHVRTVILSALTCGVLSLSIFAFMTRVDSQPVVAQPVGAAVIEVEAPVEQKAPSGRSAPAAASSHISRSPTDPAKVVISSIGVNTQVESLGITGEGRIAVPKAYGLVGWYKKGKTVGQPGPTVLVGHYAGGYGAVFDKLGDVKNGDLITITNGKGENFTYKVTKKVEYAKDKVPMQQIFKAGDESRLEIITCQGAWQGNNYDNRLVVTAELVK